VELPEVPIPTEIPADTSPFIADGIRRSRLERQQREALLGVLRELKIPESTLPRLRRAKKRKVYLERFAARRRARLADVAFEDFTRAEIIRRDGRWCYLCGRGELTDTEIHIEHKVPISRGGGHTLENVAVACADCNTRKGSMTVTEYLRSLRPMR
jgi:hypothetical protein